MAVNSRIVNNADGYKKGKRQFFLKKKEGLHIQDYI
jgi:hypothetical protein